MERLLRDSRLCEFLEAVDGDLVEAVGAGGCRHCGRRLHRADYPRKPRGGPKEVLDRWEKRASLCCEAPGCRKRHTPPSVRFLGRKVYLGVVVVLVGAMMHGPHARRVGQLHATLGIDGRTLRRWRQWWLERFVRSSFWKAQRARFLPPLDEAALPYGLVEAFGAQRSEGLLRLMRFLAPITTDSWAGGSGM